MEIQKIILETDQLEAIKEDWMRTYIGKSNAHKLLGKISTFNHTFGVRFPIASSFYTKNSVPEVYISDGIEDLERYANSKLVKKDDQFFYKGIVNLETGLDILIRMIGDVQNESNVNL